MNHPHVSAAVVQVRSTQRRWIDIPKRRYPRRCTHRLHSRIGWRVDSNGDDPVASHTDQPAGGAASSCGSAGMASRRSQVLDPARPCEAAGVVCIASLPWRHRRGPEWLYVICLRAHSPQGIWSGAVPSQRESIFPIRMRLGHTAHAQSEKRRSLMGPRSDPCVATTGKDTVARSERARQRGMSR